MGKRVKQDCSKCFNVDHRLTLMTHIDKSSPSDRHLGYFCHSCSAIYRTLPLRSLDDCPVPDELFQNNILDPQDARLTQHLTREDFDYWIRQLPKTRVQVMMNSPTKCGKKHQQRWKDALYLEQIELQAKLLNYFLGSNKSNINQSGCKSGNTERTDAEIMGGGTYHTHPREGWRGKHLKINTSDLPHEHSCQNSNEHLG